MSEQNSTDHGKESGTKTEKGFKTIHEWLAHERAKKFNTPKPQRKENGILDTPNV